MSGQQQPHHRGKSHHSDASHRGAGGVHAGNLSATNHALQSKPLLFFFLLILHQGRAGWKNSGESQE